MSGLSSANSRQSGDAVSAKTGGALGNYPLDAPESKPASQSNGRLIGWGRILLLAFSMLLFSGCQSAKGPRFDPRAQKNIELASLTPVQTTNQINPEWLAPPTDAFRLGPGDRLEIEIFEESGPGRTAKDPLTHATTAVGPDGKIYFYLLPGLDVWGLTLSEAKELIEKELTRLDASGPKVGLTLRGIDSRRVWLLGRFQNAGVYPLGAPMTLLEAIALAGGTLNVPGSPEEIADLSRGFVIRQEQLLSVDFRRLLREGDMSQNIFLHPDDFIYLPSSGRGSIYVLGAVRMPQTIGDSGQVSLVSAIASAGGALKDAYLSHVAVVRGSLSEPKIAIVDYKEIFLGKASDVRLEPGDIVYVPFSPYRTLTRYADMILSTFVRAVAINEGVRAVSREAVPVGVNIGIGPLSR